MLEASCQFWYQSTPLAGKNLNFALNIAGVEKAPRKNYGSFGQRRNVEGHSIRTSNESDFSILTLIICAPYAVILSLRKVNILLIAFVKIKAM